MSPLGLFGAADRNTQLRKQEAKVFKASKEQWRLNEKERKRSYNFQKDQYENTVEQNEENLRFQEKGLVQNYESQQEMREFEYRQANRAYDESVSRATKQKSFNQMAADVAHKQQTVKLQEDLLNVLFEESKTFLDYKANSTGLQMTKQNALVQADFKEAGNKAQMQFDLGSFKIERNQKRSQSKIEAQKAILEGMKAAGQLRARGTAGRSSAKSVLGVLAESGAMQANIANALMYAEQGIDLGVAQLQDMFILDQTMVLASRDKALNDANFGQSKLDATNELDKQIIKANRKSIIDREAVVRQQIYNARLEADLRAEASMLLAPEQLPQLADPRELYAEYDNPETEDYLEMFFRPDVVDFPEFVPSREPERDDFKGARENVGLSNVMDVLKIGGTVAAGISTIGGAAGLFSGASGAVNFLGMSQGTYGAIGASLPNIYGD